MSRESHEGGGLRAALEHGYRRKTQGTRRCRNCGFGDEENENGYVHCRMFDFMAQGRATCDEWAFEDQEGASASH